MQNRIYHWQVVPLVCFLVAISSGCTTSKSWSLPTPSVTHSPQNIVGLVETWSLTNIYAEQNESTPMMVAGNGKIVINGSLTSTGAPNIICFDGLSDLVLWKKNIIYDTTLFATPEALYIGNGGEPQVNKINWSTGNVLWSRSLDGQGLWYLFVLGNEVQVTTSPGIHTILNKDSGAIKLNTYSIFSWLSGKDVYIITPEDTIMPAIQSIKTATGKRIWIDNLDREQRMAPIFLDDKILVVTGSGYGSVYALDRASGNVLWKTDSDIVSPIAYSYKNSKVYVMTREGQLLSIDIVDGKQSILAKFSSTPFILNGDVPYIGGYEIAFDDSTQMLYVLLGDSRQLFAFKIK